MNIIRKNKNVNFNFEPNLSKFYVKPLRAGIDLEIWLLVCKKKQNKNKTVLCLREAHNDYNVYMQNFQ